MPRWKHEQTAGLCVNRKSHCPANKDMFFMERNIEHGSSGKPRDIFTTINTSVSCKEIPNLPKEKDCVVGQLRKTKACV